MKKAALAAAALLAFTQGGCALFLIGAGAAGGYAVSKDSVKSHFDAPAGTVYRHALAVVREMGDISEQDPKRGILRASVYGAKVTVTVKPVSEKTTELKVKARNVMPKVEVAQEIFGRIAKRL